MLLGDAEVVDRVWNPGSNHEAELRDTVRAVDELLSLAATLNVSHR